MQVAVARREYVTYITIALFILRIECWDLLTIFEYSDLCGKCCTVIHCVFYKYIKGNLMIFQSWKLFKSLAMGVWNTMHIVCQSLKSVLWSQKEKAEGKRVSLGWGCYYKPEELKSFEWLFCLVSFSIQSSFNFIQLLLSREQKSIIRGNIYAIAEGTTIICICHMLQWFQVKSFLIYHLIQLQI